MVPFLSGAIPLRIRWRGQKVSLVAFGHPNVLGPAVPADCDHPDQPGRSWRPCEDVPDMNYDIGSWVVALSVFADFGLYGFTHDA